MKIESASQMAPAAEIFGIQPASSPSQRQDVLTVAKGGGLSFVGRLFDYAVRFAFSIVVARAIGAEQFGLYTLAFTVAALASTMALLGLQTGMVRFLPPAIRQRDDASVWGIIQVGAGLPALLSIALAIGLFLLADPIANRVFSDPRLAPVLRLVSLTIPLDTLIAMAYVVVISYRRPEYSVLANDVVFPLAKFFLTVGFLAAGLGILGIATAHIIASAVGLALLVYLVNSLFSLVRPLRSGRRNAGQLLRYSLPAYAGWIIKTARGTLETLVLGFVGLTTGVGVYTAALRLTTIGSMFYLSIGNISTPIIADLHSRGESAQLKAFYQTTTRWLVTFNLPLFLTFVIFAVPLLSIFGADFAAGATSLMILAVGTLVYAGTGLGANVLDMTDHTRLNAANSLFMVVVTIGLDLLLIPRWGVVGAATAAALSTVLVNIVCLLEILLLLRMQPYNRSFLKPLVAGLAAALVTCLLNQRLALPPLPQVAVGGAVLWSVYMATLALLGLSAEDLAVLESLRSRLNLKELFGRRVVR